MIARLFTVLSGAVESTPLFALSGAFCWGCLSILLSPCHLTSIPLIVGYLTNQGVITLRRAFTITLVFSTGILVTIGVIGVVTASIGRMLGDIGKYGNYFVGGVFIVIALYLLGIIRIPWFGSTPIPTSKKEHLGALIMGLLFGFAMGPCTFAYLAPVLGVVFRTSSSNMMYSIALLASYAVGHCSVIVAAGSLYEKLQQYLNWVSDSRQAKLLKVVCAILIFCTGGYLIYTSFSI